MPERIRQLFKTSAAAPMLCLSQGHLQRLKDSKGGPLIEGEHWFSGPTPNSPIRWDVPEILKVLSHRGQARRLADKELVAQGISASNLSEVRRHRQQTAGSKA